MVTSVVSILCSVVVLMIFFYFLFKKRNHQQTLPLNMVGGIIQPHRPRGVYVRGRHGKGFSYRR